MLPEKKTLSVAEIDEQTVLELPDREVMSCSGLVAVCGVTVNLLNGATIVVPVGIAAHICGVNAGVLATAILSGATSCTQNGGVTGIG